MKPWQAAPCKVSFTERFCCTCTLEVYYAGTHGIQDATVDQTNFRVATTYYETSSEEGALLSFVYENNQRVNFKRSPLIALNRTSSRSYVLPFDLYAGKYRIFIYDIEQDGKLQNGTAYPAISTDVITTRSDSPGKHFITFGFQILRVVCFMMK